LICHKTLSSRFKNSRFSKMLESQYKFKYQFQFKLQLLISFRVPRNQQKFRYQQARQLQLQLSPNSMRPGVTRLHLQIGLHLKPCQYSQRLRSYKQGWLRTKKTWLSPLG